MTRFAERELNHVSVRHQFQSHCPSQLLLSDVSAHELVRTENQGGGAVKNVQGSAAEGGRVLSGEIGGGAKNIIPVCPRPSKDT